MQLMCTNPQLDTDVSMFATFRGKSISGAFHIRVYSLVLVMTGSANNCVEHAKLLHTQAVLCNPGGIFRTAR